MKTENFYETKQLLNNLLAYMDEAVIATDINFHITHMNISAEILTGYTKETSIGKAVLDIVKLDAEESLSINSFLLKEKAKLLKNNIHLTTKNGEKKIINAIFTPLKDHKDHLFGFVGIIKTITEQKRMEKELLETNKNLLDMVEKLKEAQTQLIQKEKLAGIGQLAAGVAHEINNPLGFISSNFKVLSKYISVYQNVLSLYHSISNNPLLQTHPECNEILNKIINLEKEKDIEFIHEDIQGLLSDCHEGLTRVKDIVQGLRLFSRIDQLNEFEEYDLNEGIQTTLVVANNEIKYDAEVELNPGQIPLIPAMGNQINQVLLNIVINAAYAIRKKDLDDLGWIKIKTYKDENYVYMAIEDNGIGISVENIHKIFDPFFTTKPIGEGTGLGLGIAYDIIVNKHKGNIWVESTLGEGSIFYIQLPILQELILEEEV